MPKDKQARERVQYVMVAWANLVGSLIETMRRAGMPSEHIHYFLDRLGDANETTLDGPEADLACGIIAIFRRLVPRND